MLRGFKTTPAWVNDSNYNVRLFQTCNISCHVANMSYQFPLYSADAYSEPCQASQIKHLKIVNDLQSLTIFAKKTIFNV